MIGIITLPNPRFYNYGGVLQNYALTEYLKSINIDVTSINCDSSSFLGMIRNDVYNICNVKIEKKSNRIYVFKEKHNVILRNKLFEKFIKDYVKPQYYRYYNFFTYLKIDKKFEKIIVGSDQVWNPDIAINSKNDKKYFLLFVKPEKRISYAASIGVDLIPEEKHKLYIDGLKEMKSISVREERAAEIIFELTGQTAEVVLDPTMLLTAEKWRKIEKRSKGRKDRPYLLKYFLGQEAEHNKKKISKIAREKNLDIYDITDYSNKEIFVSGPQEFLDLIDNAELICTDSFHATVFSILFEKPFWVIERQENNMKTMKSRIETLLKMLDLDDKALQDINLEQLFKTDYSRTKKIIKDQQEKANEFLKKALDL